MKLYSLEISTREGILLFLAAISLLGMLLTYWAATIDQQQNFRLINECNDKLNGRIGNNINPYLNISIGGNQNVINSTEPG